MKELRFAIVEATTNAEVMIVMQAMHLLAREGDVGAARVWLEYTLGKPVQAVSLENSEDGGKLLIELIHKAVRPHDSDNADRDPSASPKSGHVYELDPPV
jgi:hypothetical protein